MAENKRNEGTGHQGRPAKERAREADNKQLAFVVKKKNKMKKIIAAARRSDKEAIMEVTAK